LFIIKGYKQLVYSKYPFSYLELHLLTNNTSKTYIKKENKEDEMF